jgi:hypothetical protein
MCNVSGYCLGLTVIVPITSIVLETALSGGALSLLLIGKWFVFWGAGVCLLLAGLCQVLQPSFTAATIFKIRDPEAKKLVTEIGFGNLSMGLVATLSLVFPNWLVPSGLAGGLYLGLAGLKHIGSNNRTREENLAMVTDLIVAVVVGMTIVPAVLYRA